MTAGYQNILLAVASFVIIALAAQQIGRLFTQAKLPRISGYLFTGIIAGPFVLKLFSQEATVSLRFVDEVSLAFIAFAAGSELYLKELRSRFKSITWVTAGLVLSAFTLGSLAMFTLADFIPFMQAMATPSRIAVAILAGAILVARSPSSAIAIINELRAKGPFTQAALGVTVIMDVVVIVLFSINSSLADAFLTAISVNLTFVGLLLGELLLSILLGYALSKGMRLILSLPINIPFKAGLLLLAGYGVFILSAVLRTASHQYLSVEILLEPLLICMIGSFLVTNYSPYRPEFLRILENIGPPVYVAFFTLTGASLMLDILAKTWPIALTLFVVRLIAIFIGSFGGGVIAGDPMRQNRLSWMAYVTQAGVGLGLAKEVAVEFPEWGAAFATVIISVIVVNQIVGPPFFKWAIHMVGEAHVRAEPSEFDGIRDVIIFGLEDQSLALARRLRAHGWQVKIAALQNPNPEEIADSDIEIRQLSAISPDALHHLETSSAEAIVAMLSDEENYQICELAYEHFGTQNLVVRLHDYANRQRFLELGAAIVFPNAALVNLLDHLVRAPTAASLFLGVDEDQDIVDVELRNPDLHGLTVRDLRLPLDTLILSVHRRGHTLITHGYTRLERGDQITILGSPESLEQVMLRFEG